MQSFFEPLLKLLKLEKIETDNYVFRLHYKLTFPLFILFSAMLTATQYFGNPIDCMVQGVPNSIVNTYCWTHGTYTIKDLEHFTRREPTAEEREHMRFYDHPGMIHPGIRTHDPSRNRKQYYVFYQWVCFVLFLQGVSFFLPRFIWRTFVEGGKMKFLTSGMKELTTDDSVVEKRKNRLIAGFRKLRGHNDKYAYIFVGLEMLNLFIVLFQIYLTDIFLHGKFLDYGSRILEYYQKYEIAWNPMDEVFPKMTKCQFNKHGMGGGIQNHDGLCLLPLNIVNEKIYLVVWIWLIILAVASALAVIYRLICICLPEVRTLVLWRTFNRWEHVAKVCRSRPYGDWFLLRQMAKNVEMDLFDQFLKALSLDEDFKKEYPEKEKSALNMDTLRLKWTPTKIMGSSSAPPRPESVNMTDVYWDNRADVEAGSGGYNNNRDEVRAGDSGHGSYRDLGEAEKERVYAD